MCLEGYGHLQVEHDVRYTYLRALGACNSAAFAITIPAMFHPPFDFQVTVIYTSSLHLCAVATARYDLS